MNISSRTIFAQNHYMEIDSLLIHYVDFNLMTMVDISCDNFESALVYKTVVLRDSSCIAELTDIFWEKNVERNNLLMLDARFICLLHKE